MAEKEQEQKGGIAGMARAAQAAAKEAQAAVNSSLVGKVLGAAYDVMTTGPIGAANRQAVAELGHYFGQAFPDNFSAPQLGGIGHPTPGMVDRAMDAEPGQEQHPQQTPQPQPEPQPEQQPEQEVKREIDLEPDM
jgi:hypothetical protein